jgi:glutathione S-transferase
MMKLYFGPGACSFVPHAALEVIKATTGRDFEAQIVKLHKGEQKTPEFLSLNPLGLVPVLVVDGKPLTQIVAICDYLDRACPQAGFLPTDTWERAQALSTLVWMNNTVHPTFTHVFRPAAFAESEAAQADVRQVAVGKFREHMERIQAMLAHAAPWFNGAKPSFADFYALTFMRWGGFAGIDPAALPAYQAYVDRVAALPAVASAMAREGIKLDTYKPA